MSEEPTRPDRYSSAPLPPYRYVPGESPHPARDPSGHSYGIEEVAVRIDPDDWGRCEAYLYAIDLLNLGYYWEAHEALEGLWRSAGAKSELGLLLQGLIQVAAALLKRGMGEGEGARRLAARGCEKLRATSGVSLGIDRSELAEAVERCIEGREAGAPIIRLAGLDGKVPKAHPER